MKGVRKKLLAILCTAVMCVTLMPITASAEAIQITIGEDVGNTLFGARKTLDLQNAGASVQFTDADREANTAEAAQEYDDIISETLALFDPVYYDMAEYIQNTYSGSQNLTDDSGDIAEDWPTKVTDTGDKTAAEIITEAWNSISENDDVSELETTAENYFQQISSGIAGNASGIPGSRMEKYLRYRYFKYLYPESSGDPKIGTVAWYQRYSKLKSLKENSSSTERSYYIEKRAVQLNSDTINERLQSVLSDAKFDFYLESFDSSEEADNGIESEITVGEDTLKVYNGGFSDSSASSVHLTSVNFNNKDQFYDSDLWDTLPAFGDTLPTIPLKDDYSHTLLGYSIDVSIDGLSLQDYFFLFDGGSVESSGFPYVHMAGGLTYNSTTVWPYEFVTKPYEGSATRVSLANYNILGDDLSGSTDSLYSFSSTEMMYTHSLSSTGYDVYIPKFDDSGNIVSVSKPLFFELDDTISPYDHQFDRDTLVKSLDLDQNDDGTIDASDAGVYRYKMVEETNNAEVNGHPVVASSDYQIFDVVVDNDNNVHFFVYDDTDDMDEAYSDQSVEYEDELGAIGYGFTINNYAPRGSVTLKAKKTIDGGVPDSDQTFEFEIIDEDGNVVSTATSKRNSVTFNPITLDGDDLGQTLTYTMVEVDDSGSGDSYIYDNSSYTAKVTVGDSVDENGSISDITVAYYDSDGNKIDDVPVFKNETKTETETETTPPTGSISIHKTLGTYAADKSIFDQKDLSLYGFTLYAKNNIVSPADGTTVLYKAGTAVSAEVSCDKNGNAEISGILPGEYVLKETEMPDGTAAVTSEPEIRVVAEDSDSVSVYVNGQKQSSTDVIDFENYVSKTDIEKKNESGEYLAGATLQLIDTATGEVQDTWVTGTKTHKIAGLALGHTYTLREVYAPDGYEKADDITFVTQGAAVQTITMTDSKTQITTDDDEDTGDTDDNSDADDNDDTSDTDNTGDNTGDNSTTDSNTTDTNSGNGTTTVNTGSNGSTVSSNNGGSTGTSDNSATVQSVKTGDGSMLPETAAVTTAALAALGIILAARKRKTDKR
ncbi:MAG: MSCRAMM family protein [Anaerovoracaceae bacterium]|jgi:hypothetical protein